jgi:carbonic anhydrase
MSTVLSKPETGNTYVDHLQALSDSQQTTLDWLVIAHNDPAMVRRVAEVVGSDTTAILEIPQADWDLEGDKTTEAIQWAIEAGEVKHLLLVGHSKAITNQNPPSGLGDTTSTGDQYPTKATSQRLFDGVKRVHDQTQLSKAEFAEQVTKLCEIESVQDGIASGQLQLHALFYLAQCGTFLVFDIPSQEYRTLG